MQRASPADDRKQLLLTLFLFVLLLAALLFSAITGAVMHLFGAGDGRLVFDGARFWFDRLRGAPLSPPERRALFTLAVFLPAAGFGLGFGAWRLYPKYRAWRRNRMMQSRSASRVGTSEWGSLAEARDLLGPDGVIIGGKRDLLGRKLKPVRLSARYSYEHIAVIGPTGAGKSSTFYIPNLLALPEGVSAVVTDPKGELERITGSVLKKRGWEIFTFAPFDPEASSGYDPMRLAESDVEISDIASIILRNGYDPEGRSGDTQWIQFSLPLFEATLHAVRTMRAYDEKDFLALIRHLDENLPQEVDGPQVRSGIAQFIRRFLSNGGLGTVQDASLFITYIPDAARMEILRFIGGTAYDRYLTFAQALETPETAASIRTVVTSSVQVFGRPDVSAVAYKDPLIRFRELRKRPAVLFVRLPERKAHILKPLMSTFFWQAIEHVADVDGHPIFFFLDEFPNIGKIPGFAQMAATLRSRKIALCVALQGVEQLAREYSDQEQKDILNNLKTKIFYPASSGESANFVSQLAGFSTAGESRVELLTAAETRMIPDRKVLVLARNLPPFLLDAFHYSNLRG